MVCQASRMLSALSLIWGMLAVLGLGVGFIPCVGSLHWLNIPFSVAGAVVGIVAIVRRSQGGSRSAVAGTALCMLASIAGLIRLTLEGGVL